MRDYTYIDKYLDELIQDIYVQPDNKGHTKLAKNSMQLLDDLAIRSVLDVGCGTGFMQAVFETMGIKYTGLTLGKEAESPNIIQGDFTFSQLAGESFDLIYARHVLEHSPMPLLTLMEWHRISIQYLLLITPNPDKYGYIGRNHYAVMSVNQLAWLLRRAGWRIIKIDHQTEEFRFLCTKQARISYEGWATAPLRGPIYESDRDGTVPEYIET